MLSRPVYMCSSQCVKITCKFTERFLRFKKSQFWRGTFFGRTLYMSQSTLCLQCTAASLFIHVMLVVTPTISLSLSLSLCVCIAGFSAASYTTVTWLNALANSSTESQGLQNIGPLVSPPLLALTRVLSVVYAVSQKKENDSILYITLTNSNISF